MASAPMTSVKNLPQARRPQWCSHSVSSNGFEELNRICEAKAESVICRQSIERKGTDQAVVLRPVVISIERDISAQPDSALHSFNPLEVGVRPFEMTQDDIILWNEGGSTEIMDIEEENVFCVKYASGIHFKDERLIMLSDFEKQMIILANANNRKTPDYQMGSDKKPSQEQLDKVYNVLRLTVSKRIHRVMLALSDRSMFNSIIIPAIIWRVLGKPCFCLWPQLAKYTIPHICIYRLIKLI